MRLGATGLADDLANDLDAEADGPEAGVVEDQAPVEYKRGLEHAVVDALVVQVCV